MAWESQGVDFHYLIIDTVNESWKLVEDWKFNINGDSLPSTSR
jgi:hypothetical protein